MLIYAIFACFLNAPPDVPCQYVNGPYRSAAECQAANVYAADAMPNGPALCLLQDADVGTGSVALWRMVWRQRDRLFRLGRLQISNLLFQIADLLGERRDLGVLRLQQRQRVFLHPRP